jgi:hypothetical protein
VSESHPKGDQRIDDTQPLTVSLKTIAQRLDAHRSSVRRWLQQAGVRPIVLGRGRNGAIRYKWRDIQEWIESREHTK